MEFKDRLLEFRKSLKIKTKQAMAEKLGITRSLYSMLESGARKPSQNVLDKLFEISNKPDEYWLYGVSQERDYLNKRENFKSLKRVYEELKSLDMLNDLDNLTDTEREMLLMALKADLKHLEKKDLLEKEEGN
ncbi:helix-turn-helix transcriptional regulator [Clostridium botulinum D/C]|uniref:helix-turn-helix domain-containing protein n=1 Tax=Clostridium botulinum TaxID=1491 RepID=UPI001E4B004C|nr:helix-turn-helix transcriptional regulator [Clostridium botulinum]MCD3211083.1 helix-turn-helix transcriptional regulator [Clostridium botulinum C/D]MCD3234281.1 helix-turn-helix transcriptional regulator [Clostridium botulinum D/C]MCD3240265.1 helix-turn-helix transcriptional regulator [Clostridium botulinum D/C]MCD3267700.1 helix-turn-helix transcriptional regulator [Clostridium botulinum D/C]MCD3306097.1 helix-turn-helix transcriptional regulator [Clostridium botulinum D/C]